MQRLSLKLVISFADAASFKNPYLSFFIDALFSILSFYIDLKKGGDIYAKCPIDGF